MNLGEYRRICSNSGKVSASRGSVLIMILVIMGTLTIFGGLLMILAHNRVLLTQIEIDGAKAFFLAEAGIAQSIHELKHQLDPDGDGVGTIKERFLGEGWFTVIHDAKTTEIRSMGEVNGVKRTLQIQYAIN